MDGVASVTGAVECGYVYVDGLAVGDVGEVSLKDRRILGDEGFIAVTVVVDSVSGKLAAGPFISGRGFSDEPAAFDAVLPLIQQEVEGVAVDGVTDVHELQHRIRRIVGKWVSDTYRRRPMIVPTVVEV